MSGLTVVALGPPAMEAAAPPHGLVEEWIELDAFGSAVELAAVAARSTVVWLPAWSRLAAADWQAVAAWLAAARSAVAGARIETVGADAGVPLGTTLVLSRPGVVVL